MMKGTPKPLMLSRELTEAIVYGYCAELHLPINPPGGYSKFTMAYSEWNEAEDKTMVRWEGEDKDHEPVSELHSLGLPYSVGETFFLQEPFCVLREPQSVTDGARWVIRFNHGLAKVHVPVIPLGSGVISLVLQNEIKLRDMDHQQMESWEMPWWLARCSIKVTAIHIEKINRLNQQDAAASCIKSRSDKDGGLLFHFHGEEGSSLPQVALRHEVLRTGLNANPYREWCAQVRFSVRMNKGLAI